MSYARRPEQTATELRTALDRLIEETRNGQLSTARRKRLEDEIRSSIESLSGLLGDLDPIRQPTSVFDPSNPKVVGRFVALALVAQPRRPMTEIVKTYGSGVYSIYYSGDYPLYTPLSGSETPIYVGQASPISSSARSPKDQGDKLSRRLNEHRKNIRRSATTLRVEDFEYRSLVVQSGWETAAEDYLIHLFKPIWNSETRLVFGLGKHGDAAETRANRRSPWDTLHPGREWADNPLLVDAKTVETITAELTTHFARHPVFSDIDTVLLSFIEELRQV